jgi:hypothetical protein
LLPVLKNQNGIYIQDGVENVYFSRNIFDPVSLVNYVLGKNKTFMKKNISWKIKMAEYINMKEEIFQKISRFFYRTTTEWNVLIFWYDAVLML